MNAQTWRHESGACWEIARQGWLMRASVGNHGVSWGLLLLLLCLGSLSCLLSGGWAMAVGLLAAVTLVFLLLLWWSYLIAGIRQQNQPAAFALIPRMRGRSRAVLMVAWLVMTGVAGAGIGMVFGSYSVAVLLAAALFAVAAAAICSTPFSWFCFALCLAPIWLGKLPRHLHASMIATDARTDIIVIAVILASVLTVARRLHKAGHKAAEPFKFSIRSSRLYARALRRDCSRNDGPAMMMHALGPSASMLSWLEAVLVGLFFVLAMAMFRSVPMLVLRVFVAGAAIALQFAVAGQMVRVMYARAAEQGLVRLAVRAPDAVTLNAVLARGLLRNFVLCALTITLTALAAHLLLGGEPAQLLPLFGVLCIPLLAASSLLRDFARKEHYRWPEKAQAASWYAMTFALLFMTILGKLEPSMLIPLACIVLSAGGSLMARRWRAMLASPAAFPAGRMG